MRQSSRLKWVGRFSIGCLALGILVGHSAYAEIDIAGGISLPYPAGPPSLILRQSLSYEAELAWKDFGLGPHVQLQLNGTYTPFTITNYPTANLYFGGVFVGIGINGGADFPLIPFFTAEGGGIYDALIIPTTSAVTQNSALSFGLRAVPGIEFPIVPKIVAAVIEVPATVTFIRTPFVIWSGSLMLRIKI